MNTKDNLSLLYYIVVPADQTILLWSGEFWTTKFIEAILYKDKESAETAIKSISFLEGYPTEEYYLCETEDEAEFRKEQDTW